MKSLYRYSALVLGLIYGVFLLMMASDVFTGQTTLREILGFLIHALPAIVIILASFIAFYRPGYGFIIFLILTVAFTFFFHTYRNIQEFMVVSFPTLIITMLLYFNLRKSNYKK